MTNDMISREAAIEMLKEKLNRNYTPSFKAGDAFASALHRIKNLPAVDAVPVVRCKECVYWMDRHVLLNDGTRRPFNPGEDDVTCDVGINCGARCMFDADYMGENGPFRQKEDFCSRGMKKEE